MLDFLSSAKINSIQKAKAFEVSSFMTACVFEENPDPEPYWERYDFGQIFLLLEGSGVYTTETAAYPVEAGMMFYRPPHRRSRYVWKEDTVRFALISFVCNSAAMGAFEGGPIRLCQEELGTLLDAIQIAQRICEPVKGNGAVCGLQVKKDVPDVVLGFIYASLERFLAMVYCRLKQITLLTDESQKVSAFLDESRLVAEVKQYLKQHVTQQLSVSDVCAYFGASQTSLTKKFRKETNQGIMEYFTDLKIQEAKQRIQKTSESFTAISESLGFSSVNYFSKVFKGKTGMTPTEYSRHVSKRRASVEEGIF